MGIFSKEKTMFSTILIIVSMLMFTIAFKLERGTWKETAFGYGATLFLFLGVCSNKFTTMDGILLGYGIVVVSEYFFLKYLILKITDEWTLFDRIVIIFASITIWFGLFWIIAISVINFFDYFSQTRLAKCICRWFSGDSNW
jgi:hypothetical protein